MSLQVLDAGDGGGGISSRSAFSFVLFDDALVEAATEEALREDDGAAELVPGRRAADSPTAITGAGADDENVFNILKRHTSLIFQAEFRSWPTFGILLQLKLKPTSNTKKKKYHLKDYELHHSIR